MELKTQTRRKGFASKLVAGVAAVAVAAAFGAADLSSQSSEAKAADTPVLRGKNLKRVCKRAALTMPEVIEAMMYSPGKRLKQSTFVQTENIAMPRACLKRFNRTTEVSASLQRGDRPSKWTRLTYPKWYDLQPFTLNSGTDGSAAIGSNGHQGPYVFYRCTPGPRKTHVRATIRNQLRNAKTNKVLGTKKMRVPRVAIEGGGC